MLHLVQSRGRLRQPARHRVLRGDARPHHRRGRGGRDVLHAVQAPPQRRRTRSASAPTRSARSWAATQIWEALSRPPGRRARRDHAGRRDHPRARRVQRGLRLRPGRDGQLGVLRQPDPRVAPRSSSTTSAPAPRSADPRRRQRVHVQGGLPGAGRVRRRPGRRGRRRGRPSLRGPASWPASAAGRRRTSATATAAAAPTPSSAAEHGGRAVAPAERAATPTPRPTVPRRPRAKKQHRRREGGRDGDAR